MKIPSCYWKVHEIFYGYLEAHFDDRPGQALVARKSYRILLGGFEGQVVDVSKWTKVIAKRMKLTMAMVLDVDDEEEELRDALFFANIMLRTYPGQSRYIDQDALLILTPINGTFDRKDLTVPTFPDFLRLGRQTTQKQSLGLQICFQTPRSSRANTQEFGPTSPGQSGSKKYHHPTAPLSTAGVCHPKTDIQNHTSSGEAIFLSLALTYPART